MRALKSSDLEESVASASEIQHLRRYLTQERRLEQFFAPEIGQTGRRRAAKIGQKRWNIF